MALSPVLAPAVLPPPITRFHNIEESPAPVPAPAVLPPPITRIHNVEELPVLVPAPAILPPPITSYIRFLNVEELHTYSRSWETTARIISGRIRYTRNGDVMYRGILTDQSGDKMKAVAYGQQANRFNNELQIGEVYLIRDVIGIVVDVSPVRFHKSFERSTPCRDVVLLNIRWEFICLRIWDRHVSRHMTKWRRAEQEMCILAAIVLEGL
ncbi:hypothetical protein ACQ4PT_056417 [Festuca glaucescens]